MKAHQQNAGQHLLSALPVNRQESLGFFRRTIANLVKLVKPDIQRVTRGRVKKKAKTHNSNDIEE
ncbi:MAG: hypothetical protein GY765_43700 [bacterium]|nr:hypothetical protein [bacterium]